MALPIPHYNMLILCLSTGLCDLPSVAVPLLWASVLLSTKPIYPWYLHWRGITNYYTRPWSLVEIGRYTVTTSVFKLTPLVGRQLLSWCCWLDWTMQAVTDVLLRISEKTKRWHTEYSLVSSKTPLQALQAIIHHEMMLWHITYLLTVH